MCCECRLFLFHFKKHIGSSLSGKVQVTYRGPFIAHWVYVDLWKIADNAAIQPPVCTRKYDISKDTVTDNI